MYKPTPSRPKSQLESACTPPICFSREKRTFDPNRVRFWHFDRKVPATYFPLFEIEREKTPRKTTFRLRRVESTFHSKKTKQWKVQTAQKTRPNSPVSHARLESGSHPSQSHCEIIWRASSPSCRPTKEIITLMAARTHGWSPRLTLLLLHPWACAAIRGFRATWIARTLAHGRPFTSSCESRSSQLLPSNQTASEKGLLSTTSDDLQQKIDSRFLTEWKPR